MEVYAYIRVSTKEQNIDRQTLALKSFNVVKENVFCDYQSGKTSGLSNGDVVTLKWNCEDEMAEEYFNVKLDYSDVTYTVKGLEEVGKFNPFDYVTVSFSGISPNGSVTITPNYDKAEMQYVSFSADKNSGLKVGDSVTVTASISGSTDSFVKKFGAVLGKTEETYSVENLARYISDFSDIPEDMYNKMDKQLQDNFNAHAANSWGSGESASINLIGNYLVTLKEGMSGSPNNYIYFVYCVTYSNDHIKDYTYYWYGYYENTMILADGTCTVDLSQYTVSEASSYWGFHSGDYLSLPEGYYVAGFADIDSLFNQHVVSKIEKYEYKQQFNK